MAFLQVSRRCQQLSDPLQALPPKHLESIYNLIPKEFVALSRSKRYRSKYPGNMQPSYSTFGIATTSQPAVPTYTILINGSGHYQRFRTRKVFQKQHATMGRPLGSLRSHSKSYLRRGQSKDLSKSVRFRQKKMFDVPRCKRFPVVPRATERPIHGLKCHKNYIITNAIDNILRAPRVTKKRVSYIQKKEYGKVPRYLQEVKRQMEQEYQTIKNMANEREEELKKKRYQLSNQEKKILVRNLQTKWDEVHQRYQKQSHITDLDCYGKVHRQLLFVMKCLLSLRKLEMEKQMDLISSQIEKLKQPIIFVDATQ